MSETISGDHIPFRDRGIKVVNLMDFDHINDTVNYWHTPMDIHDKVSAASLGAPCRAVEGFLVDDVIHHAPVNNTTLPPPPKPKSKDENLAFRASRRLSLWQQSWWR